MMKIQPARSRALRRLVGFVVGVALIAAAIQALASNRDDLDRAMDSVRNAPLWMLAAVVVLPMGNALIVSWSFWLLMRRLGRVPFADMFHLICSSWLLNYFPLRPGLVGRLVYHKLVHGVSLKASVAVSVALALMTGLAAGHMFAMGVAFEWGVLAGLGIFAAMTLAIYFFAGLVVEHTPARIFAKKDLRYAMLCRYADHAVWTLRFWISFAVVGAPIDLHTAILVAGAVQIAYLFPLTGAGMGVVEWAVGAVAAFAISSVSPEMGIAAALVCRVAELPATVISGLIGSAYIAKRRVKVGGSPDLESPGG